MNNNYNEIELARTLYGSSQNNQENKIDLLSKKREEKLARLGQNVQNANLDNSYTEVAPGVLESNANKIWNNYNSAEKQAYLGEVAANDQVFRRDDGSMFQLKNGREVPFTGRVRRAYMYGTTDSPDEVKFGLARGDLPSSDYRYQPGRAEKEGYNVGKNGYGWEPGKGGVDVNKKYMDMLLPYDKATKLEAVLHGNKEALANRSYKDVLSEEALQHGSGVSEYYKNAEGLLGDTSKEKYDPTLGKRVENQVNDATELTTVKQAMQDAGIGEGRLGESIDLAQSEGIRYFGDMAGAARSASRAVAGKLGVSSENVDKYLPENPKLLGTDITVEEARKDQEKVDSITGFDSRKAWKNEQKKFEESVSEGKYGEATWNVVKNLDRYLVTSAPEMAAMMVPYAGIPSVVATRLNNQMEEFEKNNGRKMTTEESLETAASILPLVYAEKMLVKTGASAALDTGKTVLGRTAGVALSGAGETLQEGGEAVQEQWAQGDVNKRNDLDALGEYATSDQTIGGMIAGGAMGSAMRGTGEAVGAIGSGYQNIKSKAKERRQAELDALKEATANEVKSNIEANIDITAPVEITEIDTKLEEMLGAPSVNRLKNEASSADELVTGLNSTKSKIISEAFDVELTPEGESRIVGVKDLSKAEAAITWMDSYAELQSSADGVVPKGIMNEVAYVKNIVDDVKSAESNATKSMISNIEEKVANKIIKDTTSLGTVENVKSHVESEIDRILNENESLKSVPNIKESVTKRVLDTYGISGMSGLGNGINLQIDKEELNSWVKESAGLKTNLEQRATQREGKVVETGSVTNEELDAIMEGEGTIYESSHPNTKFRERVLRHLDPVVNKNNTVNILRDIKYSMVNTIGKNLDKAGRLFKGGDIAGNMMRLMVVAANTINGQVASDTNMRASVDLDDSMMLKDEYWASMSSTMEQIGKDYASSYGLKLTGSPEALAKAHRDIGRFAIELLQEAGIAEVTKDTMRNRVGDVVTTEGERLISSPKKVGVGTTKTTDTLTGEDVLMSNDKGVRLVDTVNRIDPLDETKTINKYKSEIGDALSRVSKLLLPNANVVPETEYVKKDLKIDPETKVNKETVEAVQANMAKPVVMKTGRMQDVLEHLKGLNESKGFTDNAKKFLGLVGTGAKLLEVNEDGKIMNRMNNIVGILDNLDVLSNPDGVHYHFQIDINNRTTIQEGVGNYQGDKDYARPIMGVGRHVTKSKAAKDILVSDLVDNLASKDQKNMSSEEVLSHYAELLTKIEEASKGDMEAFMQVLADSMESGYALAHLKGKGGLRVLNALEGARDVVNAGDGPISTEYVPEKDARASGVQNKIINIAGRNVALFKDMLSSLGVKFKGEAWPTEVTDAYSFLSQKLTDAINNLVDNTGTGLALAGGSANLEAVKKIKETLDDPKLMRELAKYPIMTWFYSAGEKSIVENLTLEVTQTLIEKAVAGDEKVLKYLTDVMGKEVTAINVKDITKGSKEHVALRNELQKIGKAFHSKLTEAFPQVEENKKEMEANFKFTVDVTEALKKATGKDYWGGKIRTALGALKGTNDTMSLYKQRNTSMGLSAEEKLALGIAAEGEQEWLVTIQMRMPNMTSLIALIMHSIDAAQQAVMLEKLKDVSKAILTKHDGFSGRPEDLVLAQKELEKATLEIALAYDIMNETAVMMRAVAKEIKEDLDNLDTKAKAQAEFAIKQLEGKATEIEKVNNPRMEAKAKLFKDAKTQMFGAEGYVGFEEEKEEVTEKSTPEEVRKDAVDRVYSNVLDMVEELPTMDERKFEILGSDVKIITLNENTIKDLIKSTSNMTERKNLKAWADEGGSFTFKGTVYISKTLVSGKDEISGKKATTQQVLDTVMHEIEHTVIDQYIDTEKEGKIKAEYDRLVHILDKAKEVRVPGTGRSGERVKYIMKFVKEGNYEQAVKELVAISKEEEVASSVFNTINSMAGIQGSALSRFVKAIWSKVQELMKSKSLKELLDASDVYTIAVAVKSIQDKARDIDKGIAKVDNGTISDIDATPFNVSGFDKGFDFSQFTDRIETIC